MKIIRKLFCLLGFALLVCVLLPEAASAQCIRFSKDIPCEVKNGPMSQLHFGAGKLSTPQLPSARPVIRPASPANTVQPGIDCAMVKPAPQFGSAMPLIKPDPNVKHTMRVTMVPPCKSSS